MEKIDIDKFIFQKYFDFKMVDKHLWFEEESMKNKRDNREWRRTEILID